MQAERKLRLSARAFAVAGWATLEVGIYPFRDSLRWFASGIDCTGLELFLRDHAQRVSGDAMPAPAFVGTLCRRCEERVEVRSSLQSLPPHGIVEVQDGMCSLQEVATSDLVAKALGSRRDDNKKHGDTTGRGRGKVRACFS